MGKLLTITETAKRFGLTEQTLRNWISKGYINARNVGGARYIDEDTVIALQDTVSDICHSRNQLERLAEDYSERAKGLHEEVVDCTEYRRFMNICVANSMHTHFFDMILTLLEACHEINEREAYVVRQRLLGERLEIIGNELGISRERVRQIVEKAIRKTRELTNVKGMMQEVRALREENKVLKNSVKYLSEKLEKYETPTQTEADMGDELYQRLSRKVVDCELSVRAINCLITGCYERKFRFDKIETVCVVPACKTLGDICRLHKEDFLKIRNAGVKTMNEITDYLEANGLDWGMDVDAIIVNNLKA